jgi:hypothetical protein
MTVAAMHATETCAANPAPKTMSFPQTWTIARACDGTTQGVCPKGDACLPVAPVPDGATPIGGTWTYCITHDGADDPYTMTCPGTAYPVLRVFGTSYTDTRACSACACGSPQGSACSSLVSVYADAACSKLVGALTASAVHSACVDVSGSPLGSKSATPPIYTPGTCAPSGGMLTGAAPIAAPITYCCID